MVSGILLAAGESSRMQGAFKPLLKWGKRTVIGECVHQLRNSQLADIFVVLGHREAEIRPRLAGTGVQFAINKDYRQGMLTSIKTGLAMLSPNSDGFLLALVDQPMIDSGLINRLIAAFEKGDKGIVVPVYDGKWGHPVIVSTTYVEAVGCLWHPVWGALVPTPPPPPPWSMFLPWHPCTIICGLCLAGCHGLGYKM